LDHLLGTGKELPGAWRWWVWRGGKAATELKRNFASRLNAKKRSKGGGFVETRTGSEERDISVERGRRKKLRIHAGTKGGKEVCSGLDRRSCKKGRGGD